MAALIIYGFYFCMIVGPIQLIGSIVRDIRINDRTSKYALGLANYHKYVGLFWMTFVLGVFIQNVYIDIEKYMYLLIPGAASVLAIYYWIIIFSYSRESQIVD